MRDQSPHALARSAIAVLAATLLLLSAAMPATANIFDPWITFDDRPRPDSVLVGEYPATVANWGLNSWFHSRTGGIDNIDDGPRSVSFNGNKYPSMTSATVSIIGIHHLVSVFARNGGTQPTDVTIGCVGAVQALTQVTQRVAANDSAIIETNWQGYCPNVRLTSTNGWATNFDHFVFSTPFEPLFSVVHLNDRPGSNRAFNGVYPDNDIDWGTGDWYHSAPTGAFTTKSISLNGPAARDGDFTLIGASRRLFSLQAHNTGSTPSRVTVACRTDSALPTRAETLAPGDVLTIDTGWTAPCVRVGLGSSNGWDTNFDNLVVSPPPLPEP